jgi:urease accessory protein
MTTPLLELRVWIEGLADPRAKIGGTLLLTSEERRKNRLRARLEDGREAGIILPRGTILHDGDCLSDGTTLVVVRAAHESLSVATTPDPHLLLRAAYHLGNRHVALQIGPDWLAYQHDHVLDDLTRGLGLLVTLEKRGFEPTAEPQPIPMPTSEAATPLFSIAPAPAPASGLAGVPLLRLLQLTSPSLPIGAFAYSQGLEQAVAMGWITNEATAREWIVGLVEHGIGQLDLPVLLRLHRAFARDDHPAARKWNDFLYASRGSAELRMEDQHLGEALARVLVGLGIASASTWIDGGNTTYATMFALGAAHWDIPETSTLSGFAFAWTEAQVGAATRIVPLGHSAAQRIVSAALPVLDAAVANAFRIEDDDVGACTPGQAIASALHETLYSRLCRS